MPAQLQEITATYLSERHRFANADGDVIVGDAWINGEVQKQITVKGQADYDELKTDQLYRWYGKYSNYKNKRTGETEEQFHFQSFVLQQPHNREGVVAYLKAAGEGNGFGAARAQKLWQLYGSDAVRMLREEPGIVGTALFETGHLKISYEKLKKIAESLKTEQALEGCTLDLMDLLTGRGFPKSTARLAVRAWGNRAAQIIRRNPYRLMLAGFHGCGFKRCDALYLDLKLPPAAIRRQGLCCWHTLAKDTEGHTWFPLSVAEVGVKSNIASADLRFDDARKFARRLGATAELTTNGPRGPIEIIPSERACLWIAEGRKAAHEEELAQCMADAMCEPCQWPDVATLDGISDHQREQLAKSLSGPIAILGGGPGTGKTYTAAALIKYLVATFGANQVGIGAPTGKAAVRVTEALSSYGLPLRARTWHSMLALLEMSGATHFPFKVLVGDETSMNDTDLTATVFRSRAAGTHVLLVGDVNQLPPVGHGAPLRDLIAAGLPYGELREIMRNSGGIVETCAAIRDGKKWQAGDNLRLVETTNAEQSIVEMLRHVRAAAADGFDPIWDVQIVVPVNAKSALSRKDLNKLLQGELNTNAGIEGSPFRKGDKIVNTKNGYFPSVQINITDDEVKVNDRGEVYVANGELAEVIQVEEKMTIAKLSNPSRVVRIPRGKAQDVEVDDQSEQVTDDKAPATGCSWDLGYAISVHKSQGSEWPVVIVMIDDYPGAKMVCSREWIYTAISRAKKLCVLIGRKSTADGFCKHVALGKRKTFLRERILLAQAMDELANL